MGELAWTIFFLSANNRRPKTFLQQLSASLNEESRHPKPYLPNPHTLGKVTEFTYDAHGNLETVEDPLNNSSTMDYDSMGRLISTTDALSNEEAVAYDDWGRPVTYTHADNSTSLVTYDAENNTTASTNELGKTTNYVYDNAGRLTSVTNAESETESYAYNNAGQRTSVTNGRGKTRTYTYTDRGEVATLTLPDSSVEAWSYNGSGATSAYTNPLNQVIYYVYDDAGRQTGIDYPTGTDVTFSYDHADRRTGMTDSTGNTGWTYNAASELTAFSSPQGNLSYTYTSAGQRATMVDGGLTTTYAYDDAGRLTNLENGYSEDTAFVYDNANRLTQQTFDTGQKSIFGYDARGRQISVDHKTSANVVLSEEDYVYDVGGNLTSKTVNGVSTTYTYDDIDQLLSESRSGYSASYTYDANGNRSSKTLGGVTETYTNDDADKLTQIKIGGSTVKSFGYDTAGRTTSVTTGAGTTSVAYDYEGRISTITYPSSATNTFAYNGLDTRVSKVDSAGTATYKRDGAHVTAPVIGDGLAVYTPGISERRSSTTKFYGSDRLGTNSVETNTSQAVTATKTYDAFGMPVASTGSSASPFGFAGQHGYQEDADSGLKLLGHRYYDASTGRFLTRDPIKDGRNWYGYCYNNVTSYVDSDGLAPGDKFRNEDAAAKDAAKHGGGKPVEAGGWIYKNEDGSFSYTYGESDSGAQIDLGGIPKGPPNTTVIGSWHTHPPRDDVTFPGGRIRGNKESDTFSGIDANGNIDWDSPNGDLPGNHRRNDRGFGSKHWLAGGDGVTYRYDVPLDDKGKSKNEKGKITPIGRWK